MEIKKVNTLTFHGVLNHGAVLQAYALQNFLIANGFESELIDYTPFYFIKQIYRPAKGVRKTLLKYSRIRKFNRFTSKHLKLTKDKFYKLSHFEQRLKNCDAVICGSDQIWNKDITNGALDPVYLQMFSSEVRKIAYAASAGANSLAGVSGIGDILSKFSSLGIREKYLVDDITSIPSIVKPKLVLDPTLLLDANDYDSLCYSNIIPEGDFIVSYEVSTDETRKKYELFVDRIKKLSGLPVYHIGDKPIRAADKNFLNIAPSDWVSFIRASSAVVTNSFHGTTFGVNFRKPLFVLSHIDNKRNARPQSFLDSISMSSCFVESADAIGKDEIDMFFSERNYIAFDALVEDSRSFLLNSLSV